MNSSRILFLIATLAISALSLPGQETSDQIKVNQLGYLSDGPKWAYVSDSVPVTFDSWEIRSYPLDTMVFEATAFHQYEFDPATAEFVYRLDFSEVKDTGSYCLMIPGTGRSHAFIMNESPYNEAFSKIMKGFYYQRSGVELPGVYAGKWARPAEYTNDAYVYLGFENNEIQFGEHVNTSGGWRDAGDANKKVVPAASAVHFMMQLCEYFPEEVYQTKWEIPPDQEMALPDLVNEIKFAIDWLLSMQRPDGAVWHAVTLEHHFLTGMGHLDNSPRYLMPVSTTATANFAAAMAQASRIFAGFDQTYADTCLQSAEMAWVALMNDSIWNNPSIRGESGEMQYPEVKGYSKDPPGINNTANYTDTNDSDEILWAASELFITTRLEEYKTFFDNNLVTGMFYGSGWSRVANLANFSYVMAKRGDPDPTAVQLTNSIRVFADLFLEKVENTGFGTCLRPEDYYWGSNFLTGHYAYSFIMAYEILEDDRYRDAALSLTNYLLGANSLNKVFISGLGENGVDHIFHLPSRFDGVEEVVPGLVPGGPNQYPQEWDQPHSNLINTLNPAPAKCYIDSEFSFASNETSVNENSVWAFVTGYFYKHPIGSTIEVEQSDHIDAIQVYPNPVGNHLNIHSSSFSELTIEISSMNGQLLYSDTNEASLFQIDLTDLERGVYLLSIKSETEVKSERILKL